MNNCLVIKTDAKDIRWLEYLLEEFKRINRAKFDIHVKSVSCKDSFPNEIHYTTTPQGRLSVWNASTVEPTGSIQYLEDNKLYVLCDTVTQEQFDISYDLFWNAFVFLSRYEERLKKTFSYSGKHMRVDKDSFYIPIVNVLFNALEMVVKNNFKQLCFDSSMDAVVHYSHDVDYVTKTWQLRFKQTVLNTFNIVRDYKNFFQNIGYTFRFLFSNPSYWCFDYWKDLECKNNKRSIFYVYAKCGQKAFKEWLIDPSYDVSSNEKLQKKLKELIEQGFEIGLHGSYKSALSFDQLKAEKAVLEKALGIKVYKTRQHWLNYDEKITPNSHNELFDYDSTLGWNNQSGFRSGIASLYRPYDFENHKAYDYFEIPQIVMDSHLFDYKQDRDIAMKVCQSAKDISKTPYFSLSWHQRVCNSDYQWHSVYEEMLNIL